MSNDKQKTARQKALDYAASLSDEEDARLTQAALNDLDARPWSDEMWARAVKSGEHESKRTAGPGKAKSVSLQLDPEVIDFFRKDGPGWKKRINAALRKAAGLV